MSKTVRKILIDDMWNIEANESWYSHMASEGLHLKKLGKHFVYFEKGEKVKTKYRIDIITEKPSQEQLDIYKECGWDFVTSTGLFYIFSSPENYDSSEIHTDPIEHGLTLAELDKQLKKSMIIVSVAVAFIICIIFSLYYFIDEPYLILIDDHIIFQAVFVLMEVYVLFSTVKGYISVKKLKNSLLEGNTINHSGNWKKNRLIGGIAATSIALIAIFILTAQILHLIRRKDYTLSEIKNDLPIIRLADVEQNSNLKREVTYQDKEVDWGNRVSYSWNLLAPVRYEVDENGIVEGERWNDNSGVYSPSIRTKYYELAFESMSEGLIRDLMNRFIYDPRYTPKKIESQIFDQLYIFEDGSKSIFAALDNKVIFIRYYGKSDIENILLLLPEILIEAN